MHLQFTGMGAAYYPQLGSNSAFFSINNHLYMIDCGESTFKSMVELGVLEKYEHITVFVTHVHFDHIGSLGTMITYCRNVIHKTVTVLSQDTIIQQMLSLAGINTDRYVFIQEAVHTEPNGLRITATPARHVDAIPCYGYLLEYKQDRTYFSGDTAVIPTDILDEFHSGNIQQMYVDCSTDRIGGHTHLSLEALCSMIPDEERSRVTCMHLGGPFQQAVLESGFCLPDCIHS